MVAPRLAVCLMLTLALTIGCGSSLGPGASATVQCHGQERPLLDCESEVRYDAANVQGGFTALGVGEASGAVEHKALRQIDDHTAQYIAQARRLCDEYNKCVLDRETYSLRSENLRRRLARVPELVERIRAAPDAEARRAAVAEAYQQLIPDDARIELNLSLQVLAQKPGQDSATPIAAGASLPTGTRVAFVLEVSHPAYAYLFQRAAAGALNVLYPDPRITVKNPIPARTPLRIPQGGHHFVLDERDVGTESVYVVASLNELAELSQAALALQQGLESTGATDRITRMQPSCTSRALSFDEGPAPAGECFRTRGLVLQGGGAKSSLASSLETRTEAADSMIATVFSFEHTP